MVGQGGEVGSVGAWSLPTKKSFFLPKSAQCCFITSGLQVFPGLPRAEFYKQGYKQGGRGKISVFFLRFPNFLFFVVFFLAVFVLSEIFSNLQKFLIFSDSPLRPNFCQIFVSSTFLKKNAVQ